MADKLEEFEARAEAFYKASGMLAPGKDEAAAAVGQTEYERHEVRRLLFKLWAKMEDENQALRLRVETLEKAIASARKKIEAAKDCDTSEEEWDLVCDADDILFFAHPAPGPKEEGKADWKEPKIIAGCPICGGELYDFNAHCWRCRNCSAPLEKPAPEAR